MRRTRSTLIILALLGVALATPPAVLAQARAAGIAKVVELTPPAEVKHAGAAAAEPLVKGASLRIGDVLRTGVGGRIKMSFDDRSVLILAENSRLQITRHLYDPAAKSRDSLFSLYEGKVRAIVGELFGAASEFRIQSPTGVAGVKGTDFEEHYKKPCTIVYTHKGRVDARNTEPAVQGEVVVRDGKYSMICEGKVPTPPLKWSGKSIDVRASETIHPPDFSEQLGSETKQPNVQLPPDYPTDIINQPTGTGGLPTSTPPPPKPPKNP